MVIHTFGDSHAWDGISGWSDCDNIESHHLGPRLCYSFGKDWKKICDISKYNVKNDDSVIFCFGEIDCRCHIHKHITSEKSYKMLIDEIVHNYIEAIKINLQNCKAELKKICIYNVVPPSRKLEVKQNKEYPFLGSDEERQKYHLYFNICLKEKCEENNWIFFNVYDSYCDYNGYLNKELSDGNVHIKDGRFIKNFINDNLLYFF